MMDLTPLFATVSKSVQHLSSQHHDFFLSLLPVAYRNPTETQDADVCRMGILPKIVGRLSSYYQELHEVLMNGSLSLLSMLNVDGGFDTFVCDSFTRLL
jgi:BarA-like signal transduction histidine kinase